MRWLWVFLWLAAPGWAQTVVVASGEHDSYSRLVFPIGQGAEWQVGRTEAGYELALTTAGVRFDVSRVFDLIPKTRLTGVFADPETGRLQLTVSCDCHALPFQLDDRTLVIDLRNGPAPPGSAFERALDGRIMAPLRAKAPTRPRARPVAEVIVSDDAAMGVPGAVPTKPGYDWLSLRNQPVAEPEPAVQEPGPASTGAVNMAPLRDKLIRQLSRGAADGVIDLALPEGGPDSAVPDTALMENPQLRVTKVPGLAVAEERKAIAEVQPDGAACVPDTALALADWGGEGTTALEIAASRAALVGEFDRPDQAAVAASVRMQLHLGFGAEAALTMAGFGATDADVPLWASLARIMDGQAQQANAFANMQGCNTAAALWAVLAVPADPPLDGVNVPAVQRAFSALPVHLRVHLAPLLAERATAMGQDGLVRAVTMATGRTADAPAGGQILLQARLDMTEGRPAEAAAAMDALLAEGGPSAAEALIILVAARVALAEPLAAEIPGIAAAMLQEYAGTELEAELQHAFVVSMAAAGDFAGAFAAQPDAAMLPEIWRLLARVGTDEAVLTHGILPPGAPVRADAADAILLAERLLGMGFGEAAGQWMGALPPDATAEARLLRARIDMARGDGRAVLSALAGEASAEALVLKAQAELVLNQPDLARVTWAAAGEPAAALRAAGWAQQWADVAQGPEGAWAAAAQVVTAAPTPSGGALTQGQALLDDSAAARARIDVLLAAVPQP